MNIKYDKEIGDIKYPKVVFPKIFLILTIIFILALIIIFSNIDLGDYVSSENNKYSHMTLLQYILSNIF